LRKGRTSETGRAYLVTFTTHARKALFRDFALAATACRALTDSVVAADATFVCWVLMPDHFHAVLRLTGQASLSRCVQRMKGTSSMACRKLMGRPVPIWARAFHDHAVRADEDLAAMARYVIANPVRAGLVEGAMQYPWWDAEWL
jgi:REP element-mobilizing transposase RayT